MEDSSMAHYVITVRQPRILTRKVALLDFRPWNKTFTFCLACMHFLRSILPPIMLLLHPTFLHNSTHPTPSLSPNPIQRRLQAGGAEAAQPDLRNDRAISVHRAQAAR